jgi:hypothetical protein
MKHVPVAVVSIVVALSAQLAGAQPMSPADPPAVEVSAPEPAPPPSPRPADPAGLPPWSLAPPSAVPPGPVPSPPARAPIVPFVAQRQPLIVTAHPWWGRSSVWVTVGAVIAATAIGAYIVTRDNDACGGCPRVDLR